MTRRSSNKTPRHVPNVVKVWMTSNLPDPPNDPPTPPNPPKPSQNQPKPQKQIKPKRIKKQSTQHHPNTKKDKSYAKVVKDKAAMASCE